MVSPLWGLRPAMMQANEKRQSRPPRRPNADNDVDAADLHLLLKPVVRESHPFVGGTKAAGIEVIIGATGTVRAAVEAYKAGQVEATGGPNVESHAGMATHRSS